MHTSFNHTSSNLIHLHPTFHTNTFRKLCSLTLCRSTSNGSSSSGSQPEGDLNKQELLAKIAMLQTQKLRLTDYLDERSAYLTQFAEEANAEIDAIGENALKDLDEASARIMENIESKMQEFEESSEMSKEEIAKGEQELADFEGAIVKGRNEGLFFKSLQPKKPVDKAKAKEETEKIADINKDSAASKVRRSIYLALMGLMAAGIADSYIAPSPDLRKVAVLAAIFVGLLSQFIYEQNLLVTEIRTKLTEVLIFVAPLSSSSCFFFFLCFASSNFIIIPPLSSIIPHYHPCFLPTSNFSCFNERFELLYVRSTFSSFILILSSHYRPITSKGRPFVQRQQSFRRDFEHAVETYLITGLSFKLLKYLA